MKLLKLLISILAFVAITSTSLALPEMLDSFNAKYNTTGTKLDTCDLCHISGQPVRSTCDEVCHVPNGKPQKIDPVNLNPYGKNLRDHLNIPMDKALSAIEKVDSAGDKIPNIDKIRNLTFPGENKDNKNKDNQVNNANQSGINQSGKDPLSILVDLLKNI